MKNVAIIIPNLKGGGAERAAANLSINLDKEKFNVFFVVYDSSDIQYDYDGKLLDLNIKESNNLIGKIFNFIKRAIKIKNMKRNMNIDTTISFLPGPNIINILTKKDDKIIVSVRANVIRKNKSFYTKVLDYLMKHTFNRADYVTVVSEGIKEDLINTYKIEKDKIVVINNSYDIEKINKLACDFIPEEEKYLFNGINIITVGRLVHSKGQYHLIRAFKDVLDKGLKLKLIIIGEGSLHDYLQDLITGYEIQDFVHILGFKNNPYKYIYNSDIFILPSISEGFPNVLVEAMICGKPVIASDCKTGPREILSPNSCDIEKDSKIELTEAGILVPVCDGILHNCSDSLSKEEKYLSNAIINLIEDRDLCKVHGQKSIDYSKIYHFNNIIKVWEEII